MLGLYGSQSAIIYFRVCTLSKGKNTMYYCYFFPSLLLLLLLARPDPQVRGRRRRGRDKKREKEELKLPGNVKGTKKQLGVCVARVHPKTAKEWRLLAAFATCKMIGFCDPKTERSAWRKVGRCRSCPHSDVHGVSLIREKYTLNDVFFALSHYTILTHLEVVVSGSEKCFRCLRRCHTQKTKELQRVMGM